MPSRNRKGAGKGGKGGRQKGGQAPARGAEPSAQATKASASTKEKMDMSLDDIMYQDTDSGKPWVEEGSLTSRGGRARGGRGRDLTEQRGRIKHKMDQMGLSVETQHRRNRAFTPRPGESRSGEADGSGKGDASWGDASR